ncbi:hypothetical protein POJ06DRAFT_145827 [Lipomyces tetrasporus]|uniref:Uncharacterized protein n=1 Tax=Lipomyces tetrasporus TaxID=54092 RepID=A0AAD7QMX1_9ASCO|nr:uncharacterized protein POJ06DRAFT_145827 [Lipomyces tetrasporus]KAJ8098146.1 hypothetical protein POJ06DRAFT_145827 [Lipomyces tetrasporus]
MADSTQAATGLSLIRSGVSLQLFGLLWGMIVQLTPFPRLALTAHIQLMVEGAMVLGAGLLLRQPNLLKLSTLESRIVWWGMASIWVVMLAECTNAFWGANQILPIAAAAAGAKGAVLWQEQVMTITHVLPSVGQIGSFVVLFLAIFRSQDMKKTK